MNQWSKLLPLSLLVGLGLVSCGSPNELTPVDLNSRYTDEQPSLSGNGQYLVYISNRDGFHRVLLYDIPNQRFINLPNLNRPGIIAESPSLSQTGRYITYLSADAGRPVIMLYDRVVSSSQIISYGYPGWIRNPRISPDGRYIVFESSLRGQWDIEILDRGPNIELDILDGKGTQ